MTERSIFLALLEIDDPAARSAYLDQSCAGDPAMRAQVEQLLDAHQEPGRFMERPASALVATADEPVSERPGTVIGPYKLLEQIGEGGFGVVFMAEQTRHVRRKVALKVLKPGMDTRQVVARFEAERQALALMDHPNIAHVFDGGETATGRPYFVMELVRGIPITEFCDQSNLPVRERLELFVSVCQAVQHAHHKGIIHRDIKPANIMVTMHDATPVPKVIDFGIAKATGQQLTEKTLFTNFAQMIGTPLYMSPEQAQMSGLDVDTRSDIYSLGVLLYELLTGTTPFDKERLKTVGYDEIRRIIREEEPPKPSTRISTLGQAAATAAAHRQSDPKKLGQLMRGELDWIVMKALDKDRNRRYETASAFAADVQRYLKDEPVQACPASAWYKFRKFARRNKAALTVASAVAVAVLLVAGGFGWMARDRAARQARTDHEIALFLARADLMYRDGKLPEALAEAQKAQGVAEASSGSEDLRWQVRQWLVDLDMAGRLEDMQLEWFEHGDRSRVITNFAKAFRDYGIDVEALLPEEAAVRIAASRISADLVLALDDWRVARTRDGSWLAEEGFRRRLYVIVQVADPDPWRQRCRSAAEEKAVTALRELAESADLTRAHVRSLMAYGAALWKAGEADAAIGFLRKVQRHHPGHVHVNFRLAEYLSMVKSPPWDEMIGFLRAALAGRPKSPAAHILLGIALRQQGKPDEAIPSYQKAIELDPKFVKAHNELAWELATCAELNLRDPAQAVALAKRAVGLASEDGNFWNTLGVAHYRAGNWKDALAALQKSMDLSKGGDSVDWFFLAMAHWKLGNKDEACQWYDRAVEWMEKNKPRDEEAFRRFRAEAAELLAVEKKND